MYRHQPIHEHLPLLGEYTFPAPESPHRLVTFLNKTLKRRGVIFGLTQVAPHEFKLSVYDLVLKESEEAAVRGAGGRTAGAGAIGEGIVGEGEGPDHEDQA